MNRFYDEADRLDEEAVLLLRSLPEDIQREPTVMLPDIPDSHDDITVGDRNLILMLKRVRPEQAPMIELTEQPVPFFSEGHLRSELRYRRINGPDAEPLVAAWQADKERIERARLEAGYTALLDRESALRDRASDLNELIEKMEPPRTLAGVVAMIEMIDYEMDPVLVSALAGAARHGRCSMSERDPFVPGGSS